VDHVINQEDWSGRNGLPIECERTINVARLLCTVCHRFLFGPCVCFCDDHMKRQTQRSSQALREIRHQFGMPKRRNAGHPSWARLRIPLLNHLHARSNEVIGKVAVVVFALSNQASPTGIAPDAESLAWL